MTASLSSLASRRALIAGGATLSAAGLALIAGGSASAAGKAKKVNVGQDVEILNAAIALEYEGIAAYQIAATSGLLEPGVVAVGVTFQGHHKGHRDELIKAVETLGGKAVGEKTLAEYATDIEAATLKNQVDVLRLALKLETGAANAYLGLISSLSPEFHTVAARMTADEAYHVAILSNALGLPIPGNALIFG